MKFLLSRRSFTAAHLKLRDSVRKSLSFTAADLKYRYCVRKSVSYPNIYLGNIFSGLEMMNGQGRLWSATGIRFVEFFTFIVLLMMIMRIHATELTTEDVKGTLASLTCFGMIFALTNYLVMRFWTFRGYQRKRGVQRYRVSSCLWTRRKVF